ncbi:Hir3p NDAI_0J03010 [Naumovozyma dairenensis CBS 421]|uniref:Histone transcription regulator 3 homolog n=1 Tax=Naumovozyma dairenensis (strain ATCC 10597 / BCRC 20456 / CBS 421 / NBRC 0211 / NRRL Y-12639) TaxID=1071378 RepID=G0WHB5_NAUDC|nr:hypothetical protein NDAI_0J03010 [Naumovozyma dairenensis CBS 421]CCD27193.1 hypothetical protein NDAI_0J03010 [Naumovozyma dairenensis CBS 421]
MSTFHALNLDLDDEQLEAEEHSRELQIEESFEIYQTALSQLKLKQFEEADLTFQKLFEKDVLKPDKWGFYRHTSPTLNKLRYLAHRNRGMYYYTYIIDNYSKLDSVEVINDILKVVEHLIESIQHSEADTTVTNLLYDIFCAFKSKKLQRSILEYELSRDENQLLFMGRKEKFILPQLRNIIQQYMTLLTGLEGIHEDFPLSKYILGNSITGNGHSVKNSVLGKIEHMKTEDEQTMNELDVTEVSLKELSWEAIFDSIQENIPKCKISNLLQKTLDPYHEVEDPIEGIRIIIEDNDNIAQKGNEARENNDIVVSEDKPTIKNTTDATETKEQPSQRKRSLDSGDSHKTIQRSSKRFRERDSTTDIVHDSTLNNHKDFLDEWQRLIEVFDLKLPTYLNDFSLVFSSSDSGSPKVYNDLFDCLKSWNSWHTDIFMQKDSHTGTRSDHGTNVDEDILALNNFLVPTVSENLIADTMIKPEPLPLSELTEFVSTVNQWKPHFHEFRFRALSYLLTSSVQEEQRLIIKYKWSQHLFKTMERIMLGMESNLINFVDSNNDPSLSLSVLEILVNMLGYLYSKILTKENTGQKVSDLKQQKAKVEKKIKHWANLCEYFTAADNQYNVLFQWIKYWFLQYTTTISDPNLTKPLEVIKEEFSRSGIRAYMSYPNYDYIPELSASSIENQLRKIAIIKDIAVINKPSNEGNVASKLHVIKSLQSVLLQSLDDAYNKDYLKLDAEMVSFIKNSSFTLKLKLWDLLFSFYCIQSDEELIIQTFFHILKFLIGTLNSDDYMATTDKARHQLLLTVFVNIDRLTAQVTEILSKNEWSEIQLPPKNDYLNILKDTFLLFYPILCFESLASIDLALTSIFQKAIKSTTKMKNLIVNIVTLFIYFYCIKPINNSKELYHHSTSELITCFHNLLGSFTFCDAADGAFLSLSQNLLCQRYDEISFVQMKQVLWCNYHISIAGDNTTQEHTTTAKLMDKNIAIPLGAYLIKLRYGDQNPLLMKANRSALKQVLDSILESIGHVSNLQPFLFIRNKHLLDEYLQRPITTQLVKSAFRGIPLQIMKKINTELQPAIDSGIFYVACLQSFHMYMSRKKLMQARPSELDPIISNLGTDLIYGSNRPETWFLLGRCFSLIVEDDLTWTSDKLSVPEKKRTTAFTQKKAVLCYMNAISLHYSRSTSTREDKEISLMFLKALGTELMNGFFPPMEQLCFIDKGSGNVLKLSEDGNLVEGVSIDRHYISSFNVIQAMLLCFRTSITLSTELKVTQDKWQSTEWFLYYHIGKILFKNSMKGDIKRAYENILIACSLTSNSSTAKELPIEPHYTLLSMCHSFLRNHIFDPEAVFGIICQDKQFFNQDTAFWELDNCTENGNSKVVIYRKLIQLLRYLLSVDKKKWFHKPRFMIAQILFEEFGDKEGALIEMDNLISLKNTTKTLVNIWKPSSERPGMHFLYTYKYIMFYLKILASMEDFLSIGQVIRKVRRFGSGMVSSNDALESATSLFITIIGKKLEVDLEKYVDLCLTSIPYQEFIKVCPIIVENFSTGKYNSTWLEGIDLSWQLKKGTAGITYDNCCLAIFFNKFFMSLAAEKGIDTLNSETITIQTKEQTQQTEPSPSVSSTDNQEGLVMKPNQTKKRISKKDVFDKIKILVDVIEKNSTQ